MIPKFWFHFYSDHNSDFSQLILSLPNTNDDLIIGGSVPNDETNDMQIDDEDCPDILVSVPYDYCSSSISYRHAPWIMNDSIRSAKYTCFGE